MFEPRDRRTGFTLVELLVVIAIISIISGLVAAGIIQGWVQAHKVQCTNNLRAIRTAAFLYAQKERYVPLAQGPCPRAHESLNVLLESRFAGELTPHTFVCPAGEATPALLEDGSEFALEGPSHFRLEEENCSYTWLATRRGMSKNCILASDKYHDGYEDADGVHAGHPGCILVVDTSGAVKEVDISHPGLNAEILPPGVLR